jgi:hypothetical protein
VKCDVSVCCLLALSLYLFEPVIGMHVRKGRSGTVQNSENASENSMLSDVISYSVNESVN